MGMMALIAFALRAVISRTDFLARWSELDAAIVGSRSQEPSGIDP